MGWSGFVGSWDCHLGHVAAAEVDLFKHGQYLQYLW